MKLEHSIIAATIGLVVANGADAGEWSVGGVVGQSSFGDSGEPCIGVCEIDGNDTSLGMNGAYGFSDTWGIELGYLDLGTLSFGAPAAISDFTLDADISAIYFAGTGTIRLSDRWSLTGKLGIASLDFKVSTLATSVSSRSDEALMGGLSFDYFISESFSAGLRLDAAASVGAFDAVDDASSVALSLRYRFGS